MDPTLDASTPSLLQAAAQEDAAHPIKNPTANDVPVLPGNDVIHER